MIPGIAIHPSDFFYLLPLLIFGIWGCFLFVVEAFTDGHERRFVMPLTVAGALVVMLAAYVVNKQLAGGTHLAFGGMLVIDKLACLLIMLFAACVALTAMSAASHQHEHGWESGEFYGLITVAGCGMSMLACAGDLVVVFIGVETMSLAAYTIIALNRRSSTGAEGAMKYFLMGAFATGFLLYGIALLYGATGTTDMAVIAEELAAAPNNLLAIFGIVMLVVAFGFKVSAVPFHMWAPDAYQGAPTPVTGFMASAVKAAAFIAVIRVFGHMLNNDVLPFGWTGWATLFTILAAASMTVANLAALRQDNIKRMLAYSSISHAGFLLTGVIAMGLGAEAEATPALVYYLVAYSIATIGAFATISWVGAREYERVTVEDWSGLAKAHPAAALAMTVFMLSFAGMPPTGGFFAKFAVLKSAMAAHDQQLLWLVVLGAVNSIISIFYYLRVVMAMYFREPIGEFRPVRSGATAFVVVACTFLVLEMGLFPNWWVPVFGG